LSVDPVVNTLGLSGWSAWMAGRPADALRRVEQGLAYVKQTATSFSVAVISLQAAQVRQCRGELAAARALARQIVALAREQGFSLFGLMASVTLGCIAIQDNQGEEETITLISNGLAQMRAQKFNVYLPFYLSFLAQGYARLGRMQDALATIAEAIHLSETTLAAFWQAEAYRVKGELLLHVDGLANDQKARLKQNDKRKTKKRGRASSPIPHSSFVGHRSAEAGKCFQKAIEVARQQGAKSLELRTVMSLSRLWQQLGKQVEARQQLAEIYDWFTEGFDTQDLQEAKALLEELGH
jgi:tetratricopeptide (TPR) repeat protein